MKCEFKNIWYFENLIIDIFLKYFSPVETTVSIKEITFLYISENSTIIQ